MYPTTKNCTLVNNGGTNALQIVPRVQPHHQRKILIFGVNPYPLSVKSDCRYRTLPRARPHSRGGGLGIWGSRRPTHGTVFYRSYTVRLIIQCNCRYASLYYKSLANPWPIPPGIGYSIAKNFITFQVPRTLY
jgi:hypothetical protein